MCGFSGYFDTRGPVSPAVLQRMGDALRHRGPDAHGQWLDRRSGFGVAHQRLAVIDLSSAGAQPMVSAEGRFVLAFNGEIYNHLALRERLPGVAWRGHSDTETLLAAFVAWGVEKTLRECVGMFAIALWDRAERSLTLARDRIGEKPLYYGWQGGCLLFSSELRALRQHPAFERRLDRGALAQLLRRGHVPEPHSIYEGIHKLSPATYTTIALDGDPVRGALPDPLPYWSLTELAVAGARTPFSGTEAEALERLDALLVDAVRGQLVADVPVGVFLSGGIDSSLVAAIAQSLSPEPIRTFTIGFEQPEFDESRYARAIAEHLGTRHREIRIACTDAIALVRTLAASYDEPFSDPAALPTRLMCEVARRDVTVALTGDGGDEFFGGYSQYQRAQCLWAKIGRVPAPLRHSLAQMIRMPSEAAWDRVQQALRGSLPAAVTPSAVRKGSIGSRAHTLASLLDQPDGLHMYRRMNTHLADPGSIVIGAGESRVQAEQILASAEDFESLPMLTQMMVYDALDDLPGELLMKVDRAAMAVSLETRAPLLDHRFVAFACELPGSMKLRDGTGKYALREMLSRYLPRPLFERPKAGFSVPLAAWLRGPLREWAEALLDADSLERDGVLHAGAVRQLWDDHQSGRRENALRLWDLLAFQAWAAHEEQIDVG